MGSTILRSERCVGVVIVSPLWEGPGEGFFGIEIHKAHADLKRQDD